MHRKKIISSVALVAGLAGLGVAAAPSGAEPAEKVRVCHGTASETNPYVLIEVSANALRGHIDEADGQAHGHRNHPDFLPGDGEDCDGPTATTTTSTSTTLIGEQ
jgi:hypothetical protein